MSEQNGTARPLLAQRPQVELDEAAGVYRFEGQAYPRVSKILSLTGIRSTPDVSPEVLAQAAQEGIAERGVVRHEKMGQERLACGVERQLALLQRAVLAPHRWVLRSLPLLVEVR